MATIFAFLAVVCASAAVSALLSEGVARPEFVPAATATAAVFTSFAVWTFFDVK